MRAREATSWLLALLLAASAPAGASEAVSKLVKSSVEGRLAAELPLSNVRVVLNGGEYTAIPRQDGTFKLHDVSPGTYLLEIMDTQSVWPTVRLDVSAKESGKMRALLTHSRQPLPFPLPLEPLVPTPSFFEKREGFQWSAYLMNPMVIMMGVSLLLMVVFPKMMANMDPEQLKEMKAMQAGMQGGSISDMLNPEKLKEKAAALEKAERSRKKER